MSIWSAQGITKSRFEIRSNNDISFISWINETFLVAIERHLNTCNHCCRILYYNPEKAPGTYSSSIQYRWSRIWNLQQHKYFFHSVNKRKRSCSNRKILIYLESLVSLSIHNPGIAPATYSRKIIKMNDFASVLYLLIGWDFIGKEFLLGDKHIKNGAWFSFGVTF